MLKLGGIDAVQLMLSSTECTDGFKAVAAACLGVCASYNSKVQAYLFKHSLNIVGKLRTFVDTSETIGKKGKCGF
jgi:hypothetical protein